MEGSVVEIICIPNQYPLTMGHPFHWLLMIRTFRQIKGGISSAIEAYSDGIQALFLLREI